MKKNQKFKKMIFSESVSGYIFVMPFVLGFLLFLAVPMGMSFYYSFCDYNILSPPEWSGLDNFKEMVQNKTFWKAIWVTVKFTFLSVPLKLIVSLGVAMLLLRNTKTSGIYRAVYYFPSIVGGSVAVAILWRRMFSIDGVINQLLGAVGFDSKFSWLGSSTGALWVLILLSAWQFGSSMLIFLSALKQIPVSLYESARVDGAGRWKQFWKISLPLLTPTIFFNLVMQFINGFLAFTQCYIITQGKPMDNTLFYAVYMYQQSFQFYNAGYGSALAWVMAIIIGLFTGILFLTKKFWVYEEGV